MIEIKSIINSGVYEADLHGTSKAEFKGKHPCIIIRNLKESDMFYMIPLTSYTKERWAKLRKMLCCRIPSTNSIARIDKIQNRHKNQIPKRWFDKYRLVVPTYDEMKEVHKKVLQYINLSFDKALKSYKKFYTQYEQFDKLCGELCDTSNPVAEFQVFKTNATDTDILVVCSMAIVNNLSFEDIKDVLYKYFQPTDACITYEYVRQEIRIKIDQKYKNYLTICNKYGIV